MQKFLRRNHDDELSGNKSFIYGTSQHNQRVEAWWSFFRKSTIQFYMDLFLGLKHSDEFDGSFLDKNLICFCFMDLIQVQFEVSLCRPHCRYLYDLLAYLYFSVDVCQCASVYIANTLKARYVGLGEC
jgi:hypothetical protein